MKKIKALFTLTKLMLLANLRNPSALFFGFLFPLIFIIVFGLIGQGSANYQIGILSSSLKEGPVYEAMKQVDAFKLVTDSTDEKLADQLSKGQIDATLVITQNADHTYKVDLKTTSASSGSQVVKTILDNIVNTINSSTLPTDTTKLVNLETSNVEGRKYTQIDFILPGQLSFALLSTGVFSVAFSFITLKQTLVLKRMFATPTPKWVILVAKALSSMVVAVMQASFIIGIGYFFFNFTLVNGLVTFLEMLLLSVIGVIVFLGLGLIVPSVAKSEDAASPIANLITMPQFLLSGAFFSTEIFPPILQQVAKLMPMTYLNNAMRTIAFEGSSFDKVLPDLLALVIAAIIIYVVVIRIFKWE